MARDVNDIVVVGFGSWSDVNALPTLGYGLAVPPTPLPPKIFAPPRQTIYTPPRQTIYAPPDP